MPRDRQLRLIGLPGTMQNLSWSLGDLRTLFQLEKAMGSTSATYTFAQLKSATPIFRIRQQLDADLEDLIWDPGTVCFSN